MAKVRLRKAITSPDIANIAGLDPLSQFDAIDGVRVYDVGQGDAVAIMGTRDGVSEPALLLDYGGRERHPFKPKQLVDTRMPVNAGQLLMLTHWDEDHWCSGDRGHLAKTAKWLVPRQLTSPKAVKFSATVKDIECIPERLVGHARRFKARNGDAIWWEKIGAFPGTFAKDEDCNKSGVALAVVRRNGLRREVILLPGDAPFDSVGIFRTLAQSSALLRGVVAFHHGAGTHWTDATEQMLRDWRRTASLGIVFSCAQPSSYEHPDEAKYKTIRPDADYDSTGNARATNNNYVDLLF